MGAERQSTGKEWATVWVRSRGDKPQRTCCVLNLGQTVLSVQTAFVYLATLSTAQTNNTKYLADSKESIGLCAVRSGCGLIKILFLYLFGGTEDIHAKPHSECSGCGSRFELGTRGKKSGTRASLTIVTLVRKWGTCL